MPSKKAAITAVEDEVSEVEAEGFDHEEITSTDEPDAGQSPAQNRLTGEELLQFYAQEKERGRSHAEIAFSAGYYSTTKNGFQRVLEHQFNRAFLEAQGHDVGGKARSGRPSTGLTQARVTGSGFLLVSQLAIRQVGAKPGDLFEVSYPEGGGVLLVPTGENKPVKQRKSDTAEQPGTPLLD
jgi:hypothetical protein